ncbi:MAG: 1,4-dihydroxy-2-naphthoate octaprenyltransferase [FCB group bacterium]|jgi:1,4-dihydroxy-2-naphthoate octaprenyltransferase
MENVIKPERSKISLWVQAVRPFAYSGTAIPVILAAMLANTYFPGLMTWWLFPVALIAAMLFQTAGNLLSDYYDYKSTVDSVDTFGSSRVLVEKLMTPKEIFTGGMVALIIGFLLGLILVSYRGLPVLILGLIAVIFTYFYTAKPFELKYHALGDLVIFIFYGPLLVIGAFYSFTGFYFYSLFWNLFWVSIPIGFLIVGVLHANNTRDIMHDTRANIKTQASVLGIKGAQFEYYFLVVGAYLAVGIMIIFKILSPWTLLVLISLPPAIKNIKLMSKAEVEKPEVIAMLDVLTAQHHLLFGLLYCLGILLTKFFY